MGISIAIDANNYDQKTQQKYSKIFERILGITEASDELNFFYISKLQELIEEYNSEEHKAEKEKADDYVILQHFFGLDGKKATDLGSIAQLVNKSFISDVIMAADRMLKELKEKRELYDAQQLVLYYSREIKQKQEELAEFKKIASTKFVKSDENEEKKYAKLIEETKEKLDLYKKLKTHIEM